MLLTYKLNGNIMKELQEELKELENVYLENIVSTQPVSKIKVNKTNQILMNLKDSYISNTLHSVLWNIQFYHKFSYLSIDSCKSIKRISSCS